MQELKEEMRKDLRFPGKVSFLGKRDLQDKRCLDPEENKASQLHGFTWDDEDGSWAGWVDVSLSRRDSERL